MFGLKPGILWLQGPCPPFFSGIRGRLADVSAMSSILEFDTVRLSNFGCFDQDIVREVIAVQKLYQLYSSYLGGILSDKNYNTVLKVKHGCKSGCL